MAITNWAKKNKKLMLIFGLLTACFSLHVHGMDDVVSVNNETADKWFIYEEGTENEERTGNGIFVPRNVLALSGTMDVLLEDLGGQKGAIPLPFSVDIMRMVFDILAMALKVDGLQSIKTSIADYPLNQLVSMANCFDYLACPPVIEDIFLHKIKEAIDNDSQTIISNVELAALNPDVQKLIMVDPAINYLKDLIINKEMGKRKKILRSTSSVNSVAFGPDDRELVTGCGRSRHSPDCLIWWNTLTGDKSKTLPIFQPIQSIAISPDGTKIAVACEQADQNNLTLWDRATGKWIMDFPINQPVRSVAWSPDGTKIVSGSPDDAQDTLVVWDAQTGDKIMNLPVGKPVFSVAWSPDGTKIASGCQAEEKNLIIWDIKNSNAIKQQDLLGDSVIVLAVAWSHDGTMLVSGGAEKNLIIWDFQDNNSVAIENLSGHLGGILTVAWSPDDKRIVSGCEGFKKNMIVWNINNDGTITHQYFTDIENHVNSVAFNNTGTLIAAGGNHGSAIPNYSLMVWTLLTEQEYAALNEIHNCNVADVRLIYQLCLAHAKGTEIKLYKESLELVLFVTLPKNIQALLKKYVLSH